MSKKVKDILTSIKHIIGAINTRSEGRDKTHREVVLQKELDGYLKELFKLRDLDSDLTDKQIEHLKEVEDRIDEIKKELFSFDEKREKKEKKKEFWGKVKTAIEVATGVGLTIAVIISGRK